jgi:UV excision repair protein RAD23
LTNEVNPDALQALIGLGFPESECRAALNAASGNPDMAYEFLVSGIPRHSVPAVASSQRSTNIDQLRQHPQFNMLKQLVQQNPAAIPQVLDVINQQSPELYAAIQANNDAFIAMMNEPINEATTATPLPPQPATASPSAAGLANALGDPTQVIQLLTLLPPAQRAQFAQTLGMSPQELEGFVAMMNSLPADQLQQILGSGSARPGPRVVQLTEAEMAAVNRLTELGFSRQQAAEAYLACDKNEELAANLLLGGGFAEDDQQEFDQNNEDQDHDEDMYS